MIDFACKQFDLREIIKCGLGLTKAEMKILDVFAKSTSKSYTTQELARKTGLNLVTIQKGVKKLSEQGMILKHQKNLDKGGYLFEYEGNTKKEMREILKKIIRKWSKNAESIIDLW